MLSECLKESGLKLPESDVREMADALYEEALGEVNRIKYFIKNYCKWSNDVNGPTSMIKRECNFNKNLYAFVIVSG